jgi:gliding motility-associated-like protein
MHYGRIILTLLLFLFALNTFGLNGRTNDEVFNFPHGFTHEPGTIHSSFPFQFDTCVSLSKYSPGNDTVVLSDNPLLFINQSKNSNSFIWNVNGSFSSSQKDLVVKPSAGVTEVMLIASNGICSDTSFSYVILDGIFPGQYCNYQKQYNPLGKAMEPFCLTEDKQNGYLLAADYYLPSQNDLELRTTALVHINEQGCVDWSKAMTEGEEEVIQSIISTSDSGYLISAFPFQAQQDNYPKFLNVFKLDKSGNKVWAHSYSNESNVNNFYSSIYETHDHNIVIEIGSFPVAGNPAAIVLIKIDSLGGFIWGRKLGMESNSFYNVGGVTEKNNLIYATGSINEGITPFRIIRSFLTVIDEQVGLPIWTKQNDPVLPPLSFTDLHNYKNGLLINSYAQDLMNTLINIDGDGNNLGSINIVNPYGSLNGKENVLVTADNGLYFHQSSGTTGLVSKDVIMRLDSNQQISWQYDFSSKNLNFSTWNQLANAPANGVAGIGSGLMANGFNALTFLKLDSMGLGCNAGGTDLYVQTSQITMIPLTWAVNSNISMAVSDFPLILSDLSIESHLFCPKYLNGCDLLKLEGPRRLCRLGDSARFILHADPFCPEPIHWTYDSERISALTKNNAYLDLKFDVEGNFTIRVDKNGCNQISDSIVVSVGNVNAKINLPGDTVLCLGNIMKLDAGNGYLGYQWQDGSNSQSINIKDSGIYWVRLTDQNACIYTDSIKVGTAKSLSGAFLPPDTVICSGEFLDIRPKQSFESYRWNTGQTSNSIEIRDSGMYILQVVDTNGCTDKDSILVKIKSCPVKIFFPNAFTPNKDGKDDIYKPVLFARPVLYRFDIYNRWGQLVFESRDPETGWDGRTKNIEQDTGTFIWICSYQFEGGKKNISHGTVLLLR